jgi:uncharacterized protein
VTVVTQETKVAGGVAAGTGVVDADIHPMAVPGSLKARLAEPWRRRYERFGTRVPGPPAIYPRVRNGGMRADSWPEHGPPGSDLGLVREQLLDAYDVACGILIPLQSHSLGGEEPAYAQALCRALNDWQHEEWLDPEPRLRASVCVPHEAPDLAAEEIRRRADDPRFVQVLLPSGAETLLGRGKYDPIYAAACEVGLPVAIHLGGVENHHGDGWPSFYLEQHAWYGNAMALATANLIMEGVFERFPDLQIVLVEGGIAWAPPLMWAMDDAAELMREELPHLKRRPSEYLREHCWFTTQPIEEPDDPRDIVTVLEHTGMTERIMFASDYPHWDFDSPTMALRTLPAEMRSAMLGDNARRLYALDGGAA